MCGQRGKRQEKHRFNYEKNPNLSDTIAYLHVKLERWVYHSLIALVLRLLSLVELIPLLVEIAEQIRDLLGPK